MHEVHQGTGEVGDEGAGSAPHAGSHRERHEDTGLSHGAHGDKAVDKQRDAVQIHTARQQIAPA